MAEEDKIEADLNAVLRRLQRLPRPKERARIALRAIRGLSLLIGADLYVQPGLDPNDPVRKVCDER